MTGYSKKITICKVLVLFLCFAYVITSSEKLQGLQLRVVTANVRQVQIFFVTMDTYCVTRLHTRE